MAKVRIEIADDATADDVQKFIEILERLRDELRKVAPPSEEALEEEVRRLRWQRDRAYSVLGWEVKDTTPAAPGCEHEEWYCAFCDNYHTDEVCPNEDAKPEDPPGDESPSPSGGTTDKEKE